ncbi:IS3 family transposase [Streptomyces sp. NBC_01450]|uniref:IS3 family transposase n=1 Tax=Streptomyces sp. NBC_01450 TaxID=2903871 RepID=UPI003FCC9FE0
MHAELRRLARRVNSKRVARVMCERGIQGAHRRRRHSRHRRAADGRGTRPAPARPHSAFGPRQRIQRPVNSND